MDVWITYFDAAGRRRSRRFCNQTEALRFAAAPPKGVKHVVVPPGLQKKMPTRSQIAERFPVIPNPEPRWDVKRTSEPKTPVDGSPIQHSWARKDNKFYANFESREQAAAALIELYQQGWAIRTLSVKTGVGSRIVKRLLRYNGIPLRTRRYRNLQDARAGWEEAFSEPTPAALYWAGFLMADGSIIEKKGESGIDCRISVADGDHIRALRDFVGRGTLYRTNVKGRAPLVGWRVYSQSIAGDLARWGVVSRKGTLDNLAPQGEARMSIDFWRGMLDGDGTIRISNTSPQVALTGRRGISEAFIEFVEATIDLKLLPRYDPISGALLTRKLRIHKYKEGGGTKVILNGQNAVSLCELLYAEVTEGLFLPRKRQAALELIW